MDALAVAEQVENFLQTSVPTVIRFLDHFSAEERHSILSVKIEYSSPLLFTAVVMRLWSVVDYFLDSCGADPNCLGEMRGQEFTCLAASTIKHKDWMVDILLRHGADTEILSSSDNVTALYIGCSEGTLQCAILLVEHGADVNSRGPGGQTCLMKSVCNFELCEYLVTAGANVNLANDSGETVLHYLAELDREVPMELVKKIIDHGFDFESVICDKFCLHCRLERRGILPYPSEHLSLQCLAAKAVNYCSSDSDVPQGLTGFVGSHTRIALGSQAT